MKNCKEPCKEPYIQPEPCKKEHIIKQMIDECTGRPIDFITSALVVMTKDGMSVQEVLDFLKEKLSGFSSAILELQNKVDSLDFSEVIAEIQRILPEKLDKAEFEEFKAGLIEQLARKTNFSDVENMLATLRNELLTKIDNIDVDVDLDDYVSKTSDIVEVGNIFLSYEDYKLAFDNFRIDFNKKYLIRLKTYENIATECGKSLDVNQDGLINEADVAKLIELIQKQTSVLEANYADLNCDGEIGTPDITTWYAAFNAASPEESGKFIGYFWYIVKPNQDDERIGFKEAELVRNFKLVK